MVEPPKPEYRLPQMKDIDVSPPLGLTVVSTFSGGGGSCLGYRMAGFKVLWANEFIESARKTYKANFPDTIIDGRSIRDVTPEDILSATGLAVGELDLFDGSPPCDPFSISGAREKKWGKVKVYSNTTQQTDDLSLEYIRLLNGLQPKTFVMENVAGLVYGKAVGYFKIILRELKKCGYDVAVKLLDSSWLGVPQARQRAIFVGVRSDLKKAPVHPKPFAYRYTVREAFGGKDEITGEFYLLKPKTKMFKLWQWSVDHSQSKFHLGHAKLYGKNHMFNHRRVIYDLPCPTVLQGSIHLFHPKFPRSLTIPELKRIASFPDDFIFNGSFAQNWERIGNCVPPLMIKQVAATIRDSILLPLLERENVHCEM